MIATVISVLYPHRGDEAVGIVHDGTRAVVAGFAILEIAEGFQVYLLFVEVRAFLIIIGLVAQGIRLDIASVIELEIIDKARPDDIRANPATLYVIDGFDQHRAK